MNTTSYFGANNQQQRRNHSIHTSLDNLRSRSAFDKILPSSSQQKDKSLFSRSITSFMNFSSTSTPRYNHQENSRIVPFDGKKDLKDRSDNIYFNPDSREKYFKNLIDSYFEKSQQKNGIQQSMMSEGRWNQQSSDKQLARKRAYFHRKTKRSSSFAFDTSIERKKSVERQQLLVKNHRTSLRHKKQERVKDHDKDENSKGKNIPSQLQNHRESSQFSSEITTEIEASSSTTPNKYSSSDLMIPESSFLPKITENDDDDYVDSRNKFQESSNGFYADTDFTKSFAVFSPFHGHSQKHLTFENSVLKIFTFKDEQGKKYRLKQFNDHIFIQRHNKAKQLGIRSIWKPYKYNDNSITIPFMQPVKDFLTRIIPHPQYENYVYVTSKNFHTVLIQNNCHELFESFRIFIKDMLPIKDKVLNNKINLSNLFYLKGKFVISEWEYSSFRDKSCIQGGSFESRADPILKHGKQWLVTPEYLAPEILESIDNYQTQFDMWKYGNSSDVYSIGLMFLEMITLVPMWMDKKAIVKGPKSKPRVGFLCTHNRSIKRILEKQRQLQSSVVQDLQRYVSLAGKNREFFQILLKMIEFNPQKRITLDGIWEQIK